MCIKNATEGDKRGKIIRYKVRVARGRGAKLGGGAPEERKVGAK